MIPAQTVLPTLSDAVRAARRVSGTSLLDLSRRMETTHDQVVSLLSDPDPAPDALARLCPSLLFDPRPWLGDRSAGATSIAPADAAHASALDRVVRAATLVEGTLVLSDVAAMRRAARASTLRSRVSALPWGRDAVAVCAVAGCAVLAAALTSSAMTTVDVAPPIVMMAFFGWSVVVAGVATWVSNHRAEARHAARAAATTGWVCAPDRVTVVRARGEGHVVTETALVGLRGVSVRFEDEAHVTVTLDLRGREVVMPWLLRTPALADVLAGWTSPTRAASTVLHGLQ